MPVWEVDGAPLVYDDDGAGPVVLLLHAGIADRRMWTPVAAALAGRFRVVRYDLRGYGESAPPPKSFAHHEDVAGLLDHLGVERAALAGCSFGAGTDRRTGAGSAGERAARAGDRSGAGDRGRGGHPGDPPAGRPARGDHAPGAPPSRHPDAAHLLPLERPEPVAAALAALLSET